jgi:hypothetical protein
MFLRQTLAGRFLAPVVRRLLDFEDRMPVAAECPQNDPNNAVFVTRMRLAAAARHACAPAWLRRSSV